MNYLVTNKKIYDVLASEYEKKSQLRKNFNNGIIDRFVKFISTGNKILDVGCAIGLDIETLRSKGFKVVGIDISPKMVNFARKRNSGCQIIEDNFMDINFSAQFDGIWAQSFIHLFPKSEVSNVFQKIKKLLKFEGVAHIATSKEIESSEGYIEKRDYKNKIKRFRKYWTREELRNFILDQGFSITDYYETDDPAPVKNKKWMVFIIKKNR
ncbi:MAG: class I SAM-dependent methyltransferase [Patescibacteria group bacterium]